MRTRSAFTLLELLLVIAIIAVLVSIVVPTVTSARRSAQRVACQANLHSIGEALHAYASENQGWLYPVPVPLVGLDVAPNLRWPAIVFKVPAALQPPPFNPASYTRMPYDPITFPIKPYTPDVMMCPAEDEDESLELHTYILNGHLGERGFRLGHRDLAGRSPSEVILGGEKYPSQRDYFLEFNEFDRLVDVYRHGRTKGSNYLFIDGHVELRMPETIKKVIGLDPWDVSKRS